MPDTSPPEYACSEVLPDSHLGWLVRAVRRNDPSPMKFRLKAFTATLAALAALGLGGATASAVTLGHAGGLKYVRTQTPLPLASFDALKAQCGGSWDAFGGGASVSGPTITGQLESTAPFDGADGNTQPDDGWRGGASNLGSVPLTLKTYAICSQTAPSYGDTVSPVYDVDSITGSGIVCNAPPWTVGGGIRPFTTPGDTHLLETQPPPGTPELSEWDGSIYHDAGPADAELRVYAICAAGMDLERRQGSDEAESTPGSLTVSAHCPAGTHVTGGGILVEAGNNVEARNSWITDPRPFDGNDPGHVPDDGWTGRAQLGSGAAGATTSAVCVD
jgi:hypothetical protein